MDDVSADCSSDDAPGEVLVVCTGNICRSPLVERLLQADLDARFGPGALRVRSAGTHALVDQPMDERAAAVLRSLGGDPDGFRARRLTESMVREADLVITATREHRAQVSRLHPRAMRRSFTLRELALLVDSLDDGELPGADDPRERVRELVALAVQRRGLVRPSDPEALDVTDPYRRPDAAYAAMRREVAQAWPALRRALI